jgi:hypothetical protein
MDRNSLLETTPGDVHALKLRPDDKSKHISAPIRMKARNPVEKIVDSL